MVCLLMYCVFHIWYQTVGGISICNMFIYILFVNQLNVCSDIGI